MSLQHEEASVAGIAEGLYSGFHPYLPFYSPKRSPPQTPLPKAIVQISTRMQPVFCPISCKTTSLIDFKERVCSISTTRFQGSLLSLANMESSISCAKREYNVEHCLMVWQYNCSLFSVPFLFQFIQYPLEI